MEQPIVYDNLKQVIKISFILIIISTFTVLIFGYSITKINHEIKNLKEFLANAEQIQPNFEKSLQIYTESTREVIDYLFSIRPENEKDYIKFISEVEDIGQKLSTDLNFKSVKEEAKTKIANNPNTLNYEIAFFGRQKDIQKFLVELEKLPYYIGINKIDFTNPELISEEETIRGGNITVSIRLYIKKT